MPMYTLAIIPLICQLKSDVPDITQFWYADDTTAAGKLTTLRLWWDNLTQLGAPFGYNANTFKTWLFVKKAAAHDIFSNTLINITSEGRPYLGAAFETQKYVNEYVTGKVSKWNEELNILSAIMATQPHAAFAAFIHGFVHKFCFLCRVCPSIEHVLECIRLRFISALTGRDSPNNFVRDLLALLTRLGEMVTRQPWLPLNTLPSLRSTEEFYPGSRSSFQCKQKSREKSIMRIGKSQPVLYCSKTKSPQSLQQSHGLGM